MCVYLVIIIMWELVYDYVIMQNLFDLVFYSHAQSALQVSLATVLDSVCVCVCVCACVHACVRACVHSNLLFCDLL